MRRAPAPLRRGVLLGALCVIASALGACGSAGDSGLSDAAAVPGANVAQGHLRRQIDQAPRTLDPGLSVDVPAQRVIDDLFEGLARLDPAGQVVPGVARRWDVSADQLQWTFYLQPDARWSDGTPVTAHDFVFAWRRVVDPATASQGSQMLAPVRNALQIASGKLPPEQLGVQATDDLTLVVQLVSPTAWFDYLVTNNSLYPVPPQVVRAHGSGWTRPGVMVGNGAFLLQDLRINGAIQLVRNPRYRDAAAVRLQRVTYYPVGDRTATTSRYLAGDLDVTDGFSLEDISWLRQQLGSQLRLAPYLGTYKFAMNQSRAPFNSPALRLAMTMAIDRELLTDKLLKGLYVPAWNLVPAYAGYQPSLPQWASWPREKRLARARALYAEAGYSKAKPLRVDLAYPTSGPDTRRVLEALAAMWQSNLGAQVRLANEEWRVHQQNRRLSTHALFFDAWIGDYPDPQTFMDLYRVGSPQNHGQYRNERYEQLIATATTTGDAALRTRSWQQAEAQLNDDAVFIPVYFYQSRHLIRPWVQGWQDNITDRHASRDLWLSTGALR